MFICFFLKHKTLIRLTDMCCQRPVASKCCCRLLWMIKRPPITLMDGVEVKLTIALHHWLTRRVFWETEDYGSSPNLCYWPSLLPQGAVLERASTLATAFRQTHCASLSIRGSLNQLITVESATGTHWQPGHPVKCCRLPGKRVNSHLRVSVLCDILCVVVFVWLSVVI